MKKIISAILAVVFLVTVCPFIVFGQDFLTKPQPNAILEEKQTKIVQTPGVEYGKWEELKGVKTIFVYTGAEQETRENIIKIVTKKLLNVTITSSINDAEVILVFGGNTQAFLTCFGCAIGNSLEQNTVSQDSAFGNNLSPKTQAAFYGSGVVFRKTPNNTLRVLMQFEDSKNTLFERQPSTNFAKEFVNWYKKANK